VSDRKLLLTYYPTTTFQLTMQQTYRSPKRQAPTLLKKGHNGRSAV